MRKLLMLAAMGGTFLLLPAEAAQAREYPWCARYDWSTYNCGFVSFQQCLATISGIGGLCEQNPRYVPQQQPRQRKRQKRSR
jgi:hypothetical protein